MFRIRCFLHAVPEAVHLQEVHAGGRDSAAGVQRDVAVSVPHDVERPSFQFQRVILSIQFRHHYARRIGHHDLARPVVGQKSVDLAFQPDYLQRPPLVGVFDQLHAAFGVERYVVKDAPDFRDLFFGHALQFVARGEQHLSQPYGLRGVIAGVLMDAVRERVCGVGTVKGLRDPVDDAVRLYQPNVA